MSDRQDQEAFHQGGRPAGMGSLDAADPLAGFPQDVRLLTIAGAD